MFLNNNTVVQPQMVKHFQNYNEYSFEDQNPLSTQRNQSSLIRSSDNMDAAIDYATDLRIESPEREPFINSKVDGIETEISENSISPY